MIHHQRKNIMWVRVAGSVLAAIGVLVASVAAGQEDVIAKRQELMKALGPGLRTVSQMLKGQSEFNAATAEEAMLKVAEHGAELPTLFPEGSDVGTEASKLIWEEFDQFVAIYADLEAAGREGAKAAAANDIEALRSAFEAVGNACGSCHEKYRT
jgi:cytochrome c556